MSKLILLAITALLASCGPPKPYPSEHPHVNRAHAINYQTDLELQRMGFYQNITSQQYQNKIRIFTRYYETNSIQFKDIDEARRFFCKFIDDFLAPLNNDTKLRPFLENYPLTWKNFDVSICFYGTDGDIPHPPYIHQMRNSLEDFICEDYDAVTGKFILIHKEPMSTAYEIYKKEQNEKQDKIDTKTL